MEKIVTRDDLLNKLRAYVQNPDDHIIKYKTLIKDALIKSPELLFALNNKKLESELFKKDGTLNADYDENGNLIPLGEWDRYFNVNIKSYIPHINEIQEDRKNFLFYDIGFNKYNRNKNLFVDYQITFVILCYDDEEQAIEHETGIARHDLISSIIRERFNWSHILGMECVPVKNNPIVTERKYLTRQMVFQCTALNGLVNTPFQGETRVINNTVWK